MAESQVCKRKSVNKVMLKSAQDILECSKSEIVQNSKLFALLGCKVRLKIMFLLLNIDRLCVCDISDILKMNQSPISQHLRKLKDANILVNKREGMTIYYSIPIEQKEQIIRITGMNNLHPCR